MTTEHKIFIKEALLAWLDKGENFTQTEIAKRIGYSDAYITKIKDWKEGDKYPKDEVWDRLAKELGIEFTKSYWQHFDTKNYEKIKLRLNLAKSENGLLIIDSQTGAGKTYALERYHRTQPTGCYYVKVHSEYGKIDLLLAICEAMSEKVSSKRSYDLIRVITEKLNKPNSMLILDEMEYMKTACWHTVKALIDNTKKTENRNCAIVISGCGIEKKLNKYATSKNGEQGWQQLLSRFKGNFPQLSLMQLDKKEWFNEITKILEQLNISDKEVALWLSLNCSNYRELETAIKRGLMAADKVGAALNIYSLKILFE